MRAIIAALIAGATVLSACGDDTSSQSLETLIDEAAHGDAQAMSELEKQAAETAATVNQSKDAETVFQTALFSGDPEAVLALSDAGNVFAQTHLAANISVQNEISETDLARGQALLEAAVAADHAPAVFRMSEDYRASNRLYPLDEAKAFELGIRAAELGHPEAMYETGIRYQYGLLTAPKDAGQARLWLERANAAGFARAQTQLNELAQD